MKSRTMCSVLAATFVLSGCTAVFDMLNKQGLQSDLSAFLQEKDLSVPLQSCRMITGSRSGYCFTVAGEQELQQLIQVFNLKAASLTGFTAPMDYELGCGSAMKATKLYASQGNRPQNLRMEPGKAFDYLYVAIGAQGSKSCIQTSFSFG